MLTTILIYLTIIGYITATGYKLNKLSEQRRGIE